MKKVNKPNTIPVGTVMNTTINGKACPLKDTDGYSFQTVFTGTPTGSFKIQASDDPVSDAQDLLGNPLLTPTNWTDVANTSTNVSAAGSAMWNVSGVKYNWARLVYTDSSSGSSTAVVTVSTFNATGPK